MNTSAKEEAGGGTGRRKIKSIRMKYIYETREEIYKNLCSSITTD